MPAFAWRVLQLPRGGAEHGPRQSIEYTVCRVAVLPSRPL